jgi:hypothetical protein
MEPTSPSRIIIEPAGNVTGYMQSTISRICVSSRFFIKSLSNMAALINSRDLETENHFIEPLPFNNKKKKKAEGERERKGKEVTSESKKSYEARYRRCWCSAYKEQRDGRRRADDEPSTRDDLPSRFGKLDHRFRIASEGFR